MDKKITEPTEEITSPIWITVFDSETCCWSVTWGGKGNKSPISLSAVKKLSAQYLEEHKEDRGLVGVRFIAPCGYGGWHGMMVHTMEGKLRQP